MSATVPPPPSTKNNFLSISFCRVDTGKESQLFNQYSEEFPSVLLYKALGEYDLVAFQASDVLIPIEIVSEYNSNSSVVIKGIENSQYTTPIFSTWVSNSCLVGFVLLEIDKSIYGYLEQSAVVDAYVNKLNTEINDAAEVISFYRGLGRSDIYAIVKASDVDHLAEIVSVMRGVVFRDVFNSAASMSDYEEERLVSVYTNSVLISTTTMILVSYSEVIKESEYDKICSKVTATVDISCTPGFERHIQADPLLVEGCVQSTLGYKDLFVTYSSLELGRLIQKLMSFREKWGLRSPLATDTHTRIHFVQGKINPIAEQVSDLPVMVDDCDEVLDENGEKAKTAMMEFAKYNYKYYTRLTTVSARLELLKNNRGTESMVHQLLGVRGRLLGWVIEYMIAKQNGNGLPDEGIYLRIITCLEQAIMQRVSSVLSGSSFGTETPRMLGDGFYIPTIAVECLIGEIFKVYAHHCGEVEAHTWEGCALFSNEYGYQYSYGDIFCLPVEAALSPVGKNVNWLVLTHEISHAIFTILEIDDAEEDIFRESIRNINRDKEAMIEPYEIETVKDTHFELFASWFDFYHFYDGKLEFYQVAIWNSWGGMPLLTKEPGEYIFRSFAIFVLADLDAYNFSRTQGAEKTLLEEKWTEYVHFMYENVPDIAARLDIESEKRGVFKNAEYYLGPFSKIPRDYRNEDFRAGINKNYEEIDLHVSAILRGEVIPGGIVNPFLLIRKLIQALWAEKAPLVDASSMSLILSIANRSGRP